jgi:Domain of Unknown Function (DUF1080)
MSCARCLSNYRCAATGWSRLESTAGKTDAAREYTRRGKTPYGTLGILRAVTGFLGVCAFGLAAAQPTDPRTTKFLEVAGLCHAGEACVMTEDKRTALEATIRKTEQWEPVPAKVQPGIGAAPPSDAIILFDGRNLDAWVSTNDRTPARWEVKDGVLTVVKAAGNIETRQQFKSYQLHLEWRIPKGITGEGQERGNSGLFLASTGPDDAGYEIQILDSWNNPTYVNGQAASLYKQSAPLVNASRPPGQWQSYDVVWTAPTFAADGALNSPAYVTLLHNGILVQNHTPLTGETVLMGKPFYVPYERAAVKLQAHGDQSTAISFRNIWIRELNESQ